MNINFEEIKYKAIKIGKRILPTLLVIIFFILWTCGAYAIGRHKGKVTATKEVTEELTTKFEDEKAAYIAEMTYVPEDEEKNRQIDNLANYLDELIAGYSMNSNINVEGCYAIGWCFIARYMTGGYFGSTPEEILNMENQWQWYKPDNPVRPQDRAIAQEIATAYYNRDFPDRYTTDLCYAEILQNGTVELRNMLFTDKTTKYWTYKMS